MERFVRSYINNRIFVGSFNDKNNLDTYDPGYKQEYIRESLCVRDLKYLDISYTKIENGNKQGRILNVFYFHGNGETVRSCQEKALSLARELVLLETEYSDFDTCHFYMFEYPSYCPVLSGLVDVKDIDKNVIDTWCYDVARTIKVDIINRKECAGSRNVFMGYSLGCGFSLNVLNNMIILGEGENPIEECILFAPFISLASIWRHHFPKQTWFLNKFIINDEEVDYFQIDRFLQDIKFQCNVNDICNLHFTIHICTGDQLIPDYGDVVKMFQYIFDEEKDFSTVLYSGAHGSLAFNLEKSYRFYSFLRKNIKKLIKDKNSQAYLLL